GRTLVGEAIRECDREEAQRVRSELAAALSRAFKSVDGLLIPGALAPSSKLGNVDKYYFLKDPIPNIVANVTGHPSLAFPTGLSRTGLPVGMQMIGSMGSEEQLLAIAGRLLTIRSDWKPRPPGYFR